MALLGATAQKLAFQADLFYWAINHLMKEPLREINKRAFQQGYLLDRNN